MNTKYTKIADRIAVAEAVLAPFAADAQRQWAQQDSKSGKWTPGIADGLCRAYCYALTGFANHHGRAESFGWYFLISEARAALDGLKTATYEEDYLPTCLAKVAELERAAEIAKALSQPVNA